jgi:hypothetical protein
MAYLLGWTALKSIYRWTAVFAGNTFQDLQRLHETTDNTEHRV